MTDLRIWLVSTGADDDSKSQDTGESEKATKRCCILASGDSSMLGCETRSAETAMTVSRSTTFFAMIYPPKRLSTHDRTQSKHSSAGTSDSLRVARFSSPGPQGRSIGWVACSTRRTGRDLGRMCLLIADSEIA